MATWNSPSLSQSDLNIIINTGGTDSNGGVWTSTTVQDGDTVRLPAGNVTWTSQLSLNKIIRLIGAKDPTTALLTDPGITTINGGGILWRLHPTNFTTQLSNLHLRSIAGNSFVTHFKGVATVRLVGGVATGGLRVDHIRWTADASGSAKNYHFILGGQDDYKGWITGVMDHCYVDHDITWQTAEITDFSHPSSPTGDTTPVGTIAQFGNWSWFVPFVYGGGLSNYLDAGPNHDGVGGRSVIGNGELDGFYIEDCIIHNNGAWQDGLSGGGRVINRHNTNWASNGGHGLDSGHHIGPRALEFYNNNNINNLGSGQPFNSHTLRSGGVLIFNSYYTAWANKTSPQTRNYRCTGEGSSMGGGDAINWFDRNERDDPLIVNGFSFPAVRVPGVKPSGDTGDLRCGAIYATGTQTSGSTLLDMSAADANKNWTGFTLRNASAAARIAGAPTESNGSQVYPIDVTTWCFINGNTGNTMSLVTHGHWGGFSPGDTWEIRRVRWPVNGIGGGQMDSLHNGGNLYPGYPAGRPLLYPAGPNPPSSPPPSEVDPPSPPPFNPRWTNEDLKADGIWQWANQSRTSATSAWGAFPLMGVSPFAAQTLGGIHDNVVKTNYPTQLNTPANLRVGADWAAPNLADPTAPNAINAWGEPYPHPLVSGAPPPPLVLVPPRRRKRILI